MSQAVASNESRFLKKFIKLTAIFDRSSKMAKTASLVDARPIDIAEVLIEKAKSRDLMQASPLGAIQIGIERINQESKNYINFKDTIAKKVFAKNGNLSQSEIAALWENSDERKMITEIYALINLSSEVGRAITFRDAFIRVYEAKQEAERAVLNKIARAIVY